MANETRAELLKELSGYATPGTVDLAERLNSDEQIRDMITGAKEQRRVHEAVDAACRASAAG